MQNPIAPVLVRIALRYLSGALVAWGLVSPDLAASLATDPEIQSAILVTLGIIGGAISEMLYARARASGGPT